MKLSRPIRRTPPEAIIALIDVVFFLLVFFMLIGRMDATSPFEVLPATGLTGTDLPAGGITLAIGADGTLALGGEEISPVALIKSIEKKLSWDPATPIRVNAHRDTVMADLLPLIAQIEALGSKDVMLVITPEKP